MSKIRADEISNANDDGAPNFQYGIKLGGAGRWKKKTYVSASSDLDFTLENGKWYEISVYARTGLGAAAHVVAIDMNDGSGRVGYVLHQNINTASSMIVTGNNVNRFQMTGTALTATVTIMIKKLLSLK